MVKIPWYQSTNFAVIGFVFMLLCVCGTSLLMPSDFRSSILPKIEEFRNDIHKETDDRNKAIAELNSKIEAVKKELNAHTSRAHVFAERPKK